MTSRCSGSRSAREPSAHRLQQRPPELTASPVAGSDLDDMARMLASEGLPTAALREPGRILFHFAAPDGTPVGYGGFQPHGADFLARSIVVAPSARGRGHGKAVVHALIVEAEARGAASAWLLTTTAADLFVRLGFAPVLRDAVPSAIAGTTGFGSLCPASATVIRKTINSGSAVPVTCTSGL